MKYAERLFSESRWSRSTYACLKASFLLMSDDDNTRDHVTYLMQYACPVLLCNNDNNENSNVRIWSKGCIGHYMPHILFEVSILLCFSFVAQCHER